MSQVYDGVKCLSQSEKAPVKGFTIIAALICLIVLLACTAGMHQALQMLQSTISDAIGGTVKDGLGSVFGGLFG